MRSPTERVEPIARIHGIPDADPIRPAVPVDGKTPAGEGGASPTEIIRNLFADICTGKVFESKDHGRPREG